MGLVRIRELIGLESRRYWRRDLRFSQIKKEQKILGLRYLIKILRGREKIIKQLIKYQQTLSPIPTNSKDLSKTKTNQLHQLTSRTMSNHWSMDKSNHLTISLRGQWQQPGIPNS